MKVRTVLSQNFFIKILSNGQCVIVDKVGRANFRGDPSSALLEILDIDMNNTFQDLFLDVPVDMSQVLFVTTANEYELIPLPLKDRMEHIVLSGYIAEEKVAIAEKYLAPNARQESGLEKYDVKITNDALTKLVEQYCWENGVRTLKRIIEKVYRRAALNIVGNSSINNLTIDSKNLNEYAGSPTFGRDLYYQNPPVGVVAGLSVTPRGKNLHM